MGPNAGVPVKTGRLCTGAYLKYSPIAEPGAGVFPVNYQVQTSDLPTGPGSVNTKPNAVAYKSPIANHYNVATIHKQEPKVWLNNLFAFHPNEKPRVQPQLRSTLPMRKVKPVVHMSNGGSPNLSSDTAFHPINQPAPIPKINSERNGEQNDLPSFSSHNNLWYGSNQSFYKDQPQIGSDRVGLPRWLTIKKGAVS